jgi:hypothetical protein
VPAGHEHERTPINEEVAIMRRLILCATALALLAGCGERSDWSARDAAWQGDMRTCVRGDIDRVEGCYKAAYKRADRRR